MRKINMCKRNNKSVYKCIDKCKEMRCSCIEDKELIEREWNKYKKQKAILIDVRSEQEFSEEHIKGAISIPYYELPRRAKQELIDKNKKIILYCNTGVRSKKAENILRKMSYKNVSSICQVNRN